MRKDWAILSLGFFILSTCSKSSDPILSLSSAEAQDIGIDLVSEAFTNETAEISNQIIKNAGDSVLFRSINQTFPIGKLKKWDPRLVCALVTIGRGSGSTATQPQGIITIYYDSTTTCSDTTGVQRKGTIVVNCTGYRYANGSTRMLTYHNYSRSGVLIKGTCLMTNTTDSLTKPYSFSQAINSGLITLANGETGTRTQKYSGQWIRDKAGVVSDTLAHYLSGGTANGLLKDSVLYQTVINQDLISSRSCYLSNSFLPVLGSKTIRLGNTALYIDYGISTCDNSITVTYNGKSKTIVISSLGN